MKIDIKKKLGNLFKNEHRLNYHTVSRGNDCIRRFVEFVDLYCLTNGITVTLSPEEYIGNVGGLCNGYFDHEVPELTVATKKPFEQWLPIFVHEFSHATQWVEDCDEWHICTLENGEDAYTLLGEWMEGKLELSKEQVACYATLSRLFEQDCDKRAYNLIKAWKLPIDLDEYVQRSNAYHIFYEYIGKSRKWYPTHGEPYNIESIWKKMPTCWVDYPPPYMIDLYEDVYGGRKTYHISDNNDNRYMRNDI